ncbi:general odorant-binding protein 56a-like [Neocloeon triangulifer]|uniref:general odorant-binding protein 56a-like n=1 Tax=Neocloeon triangulifer TaxID=2078957 RepID=UPI00286F0AEA|nr:general odorant-binding protein 56a-like [Neocloeon triangulifer]
MHLQSMMRFWTTILFALLFAFPLIQGKTLKEWQQFAKDARKECAEQLELSDAEFNNFNSTLKEKNNLADFTAKQRCFMKCVTEKLTGESMNDMEKFMGRTKKLLDEIPFNISSTKKEKLSEIIIECQNLRGENDCDTIVLIQLCEKEKLQKFDFATDDKGDE